MLQIVLKEDKLVIRQTISIDISLVIRSFVFMVNSCVIFIKTKVLLPQKYVAIANLAILFRSFRFIAAK